MEPGIIILASILLLLLLVYLFQAPCVKKVEEGFADNSENSKNSKNSENSYNEYTETYVNPEKDLDIDKLYQNYEGPLKGLDNWTESNLDQCKKNCDVLGENCLGFIRSSDAGDDNQSGSCSPLTSLTHCRNSRRGSNSERNNSLKYNSYIKSNVANQMNVCVGSDITLNRIISIQPVRTPYKYLIADNFKLMVKSKPSVNVANFINNSKFKIVDGLEGAGTVSFKLLRQTADKEYYIGHNYPDSSNIKVVDINPSKSTSDERRRVSFKLLNGLANKYTDKLSIKLLNPQGNKTPLYLQLSGHSLLVYQRTDSSNDQEATFNIVDPINNQSIVNKKDGFANVEGMVGRSIDKRRSIKQNDRYKLNHELDINNNIPSNNGSNNASNRQNRANFEDVAHKTLITEMEKGAFGESRSQTITEQREQQLKTLKDQNFEIESEIDNEINSLSQKVRDVDTFVKSLNAQDIAKDYFFLKSLEKSGLYGSNLSN